MVVVLVVVLVAVLVAEALRASIARPRVQFVDVEVGALLVRAATPSGDEVAAAHFPAVDLSQALQRPLLYSNWLRRTYQSTGRDELRDFVAARCAAMRCLTRRTIVRILST